MRTLALLLPLYGLLAPAAPCETAAVSVVPDGAPQFAFSGPGRIVRAAFSNPGGSAVELALRARLFQADSATVMPLGPAQRCKTIKILARQTVLESAAFSFPDVRALTAVEVRWLDSADRELGRTLVWVCPPAMLKELDRPGATNEIGILDPLDRLKPTLSTLGIRFQDLDTGAGLDGFAGKLAIVGPFFSDEEMPFLLRGRMARALKRPMTILWLRPMPATAIPNAYWTTKASGVIAVADAQLVADLADSALAQLNLLHCVAWAEHPSRNSLEELATESDAP